METIWEDEPSYPSRVATPITPISEKVHSLEEEVTDLKRKQEAAKETKQFRFPFKWMWRFNKARRKVNIDKVLIMFFNKKNEIEMPTFVPIYSGNIVIYKNKAYEYDPRGVWRMRGVRGYPSVYPIREIDRRPMINPQTGKLVRDKASGKIVYSKDASISNGDIDEVRARGDSTESDEFLIKAALKAYTGTKPTKPVNWLVIGIVLVVVCLGIFFLLRSNIGG